MIDSVTVTPRRQRMIEDMTIRQFGEHTQGDYIRQVREFTAFLGVPPDRAGPEDLRRYQLRLASLGASVGASLRLRRAPPTCVDELDKRQPSPGTQFREPPGIEPREPFRAMRA